MSFYIKNALTAYATTMNAFLFSFSKDIILFLRSLTVAAHELINTTSGVNELALTGVEGVRSARNFKHLSPVLYW